MKTLYTSITMSTKELKSVRNLVLAGLLISLKLIFSMFTLYVSPMLRISFTFMPSAFIGMLLGPSVGAMSGAIGDILCYVVRPSGPFNPAFTLISILSGFIYGVVFYNKKVTIKRCIICELIMVFLINITLTTLALSLMYGKGFFALLPLRALKSFIQAPINIFLLYITLTTVQKIHSKTTR
ncbi:folate family ECF transporter S component [Clostridium sp. BJN0001]|uniref:folate family ECF transporter S component n=1 Tax=Clostridium sp. BJN0001 TaxID=2930219 RepID=UPI001FCFF211|nr:folate family ECF transporter S component [Clostridium sp. BJN0001]